MSKIIDVTFPGGKRVDAHYDGRTVCTDQSVKNGGDASAPEPFDLFFVSMATCVGIYALEFCNARKLNTDKLGVQMIANFNKEVKRYTEVKFILTLPDDFPEKYIKAITKTVNLCTVKKHIMNAPNFEVEIVNS